jgi:hypothetical protein
MIRDWKQPHRDTLFEVEHILGLDTIATPHGLHIHLMPEATHSSPSFVIGYTPIALPR